MLTVNKSLQFTPPNLINFNTSSVTFDDRNVLDRADLRAENTPDSVLDRLVLGNQQFVEMRAKQIQRNNSIRLSGAAKGNNPFAAILNYAKLSTSAEEIFDRKFGELFTIDSSVQTTTRKEISAIEYGVLMLGIKVVVVLTNAPKKRDETNCQERDRHPHQPFKVEIEHKKILVSGTASCVSKSSPLEHGEHQQPTCEDSSSNSLDPLQERLHQQVNKLKTSKLLSQFISTGSLKIVGGLYDVESCRVTIDS
jgi:carbonic anhydrase